LLWFDWVGIAQRNLTQKKNMACWKFLYVKWTLSIWPHKKKKILSIRLVLRMSCSCSSSNSFICHPHCQPFVDFFFGGGGGGWLWSPHEENCFTVYLKFYNSKYFFLKCINFFIFLKLFLISTHLNNNKKYINFFILNKNTFKI